MIFIIAKITIIILIAGVLLLANNERDPREKIKLFILELLAVVLILLPCLLC